MENKYANTLLESIDNIKTGLKHYAERCSELENELKLYQEMYENRVEEYDRDTHILQNQLDLADAKNIEKDKIIDLMLDAFSELLTFDNNKDEVGNLEVTIPWNDSCKLEELRKSISPNALFKYLVRDYNKLYEEFKAVDHECTRLEEKELKLIDENNHLNDLLSALETYYDITQEDLENSIKLDK